MKGILFRPEMIKAIQSGTKTVTRRLVGLKEINQDPDAWELSGKDIFHNWLNQEERIIKPRYQVGEVVYIKEAWAVDKAWDDKKPSEINKLCSVYYFESNKLPLWVGRKRSPLFMPAWAARDFIQITGVRAERLNQISAEDILAEGVGYADMSFRELWDSINKDYPWSSNPWVFVYTFVKVKGNA